MFLEILQNSQENTCARVSFLIKFIKKETLVQVFSCEFYEISKNTIFTEHLWTTASEYTQPFTLGFCGNFATFWWSCDQHDEVIFNVIFKLTCSVTYFGHTLWLYYTPSPVLFLENTTLSNYIFHIFFSCHSVKIEWNSYS